MSDHCFDITAALEERPVELVLGYVGSDLVMCAVRKSLKDGRHVAAMWEVQNGLHKKQTVALLSSFLETEKLIENLFLLYGKDDTNLRKIRLVKKLFHSADQDFWDYVGRHDLRHAIANTRLSSKMQQQLRSEAERLGEKRL